MLEGIGLGLAGPSFFTACFSPGVDPRSPPARIRRSRRVQLRWSGVESSGHAALNTVPSGTTPLGDIAPQGDEEFAGQRDDGDPADPSLRGADSRLKPVAQRRVRLVTQPEPGKLDHGFAQAAIARLRDALIPFDATALPGTGRQSAVSRHLASVAEAAKQRFQPEERGELRAQAFELEKQGGGVVRLLGG